MEYVLIHEYAKNIDILDNSCVMCFLILIFNNILKLAHTFCHAYLQLIIGPRLWSICVIYERYSLIGQGHICRFGMKSHLDIFLNWLSQLAILIRLTFSWQFKVNPHHWTVFCCCFFHESYWCRCYHYKMHEDVKEIFWKKGNVWFNDELNTF